jgi:hypothetical protein
MLNQHQQRLHGLTSEPNWFSVFEKQARPRLQPKLAELEDRPRLQLLTRHLRNILPLFDLPLVVLNPGVGSNLP